MKTLKEFCQSIRENHRNIICFGTGLMGEEALSFPEIRSAVRCFADNDVGKQGHELTLAGEKYSVLPPEQIASHLDSQTVILITSGHYQAIEKQLRTLLPKETEIFIFPILKVSLSPDSEDFFEERILKECLKEYETLLELNGTSGEEKKRLLTEKEAFLRGKDRETRPFVIPRTMIMPTTRCNLRCKGCSSLLPLFQNPKDVDIDRILRDCDLFFSGVDQCIRLTIGGEPFLYPELEKVLERLIAEPKLLGILMITNGMRTPEEALVPLLKHPKIFLELSDYGRLEPMSRTVSFFEKHGIRFEVLTEQEWTDMGDVSCRNRTEEELKFVYLNCDQGRVIKGMHDGRFYTCARSARMRALGAYESERDSFSLEEHSGNIREKLRELYYSDHADACNYCDLGALPTKVIPAGIQMNDQMPKSSYTIVSRAEYETLKRQVAIGAEKSEA